MAKKYWLIKSEPETYSIDRLAKDKTTWWEGVRNYQARNFMSQDMQPGDEILYYHSSTTPPGVVGLAVVTKGAAPDQTQFDAKSDYFEPKATAAKPIWFCVEVGFAAKFKSEISLEQLRLTKGLEDMLLLKKGQRLSIQPVTATEFKLIKKIGETAK